MSQRLGRDRQPTQRHNHARGEERMPLWDIVHASNRTLVAAKQLATIQVDPNEPHRQLWHLFVRAIRHFSRDVDVGGSVLFQSGDRLHHLRLHVHVD